MIGLASLIGRKQGSASKHGQLYSGGKYAYGDSPHLRLYCWSKENFEDGVHHTPPPDCLYETLDGSVPLASVL